VTANPELFWGLRGGGGGFGVISSFMFRLHSVSTVLGGLIMYPRNQAATMLRNYRAFMATAPQDVTANCALATTSPDGTPVVAVALCYSGDISEGERVIDPLRSFGSPFLDTIQRMPFPDVQRMFDQSHPPGTYNYWKSTFVNSLSDDVIDTFVEHGNLARSSLSCSFVEFYGGGGARDGHPDTAFSQRKAEYNILMMAQWSDPGESEQHVSWAGKFWEAMRPYSSGSHLLNLSSDTSEDAARAMFGGNYERLVALKSKYDPRNLFVGSEYRSAR
jgi:Berberine and berberine like